MCACVFAVNRLHKTRLEVFLCGKAPPDRNGYMAPPQPPAKANPVPVLGVVLWSATDTTMARGVGVVVVPARCSVRVCVRGEPFPFCIKHNSEFCSVQTLHPAAAALCAPLQPPAKANPMPVLGVVFWSATAHDYGP